jgi:hypothetical protein
MREDTMRTHHEHSLARSPEQQPIEMRILATV